MKNSNELGAVDLMILAVIALAWATWQVVRLLLVPLLAGLIVLLTPRRRPAPQPVAVAPTAASDEAPAPCTATVEAAPAEQVPAPLSLATIGADLLALPAAELRRLAGTRRRLPKAQLIAAICAMPL